MLLIGLFVSFFIGDTILISGLKQEKKLTEKTEKEVAEEEVQITLEIGVGKEEGQLVKMGTLEKSLGDLDMAQVDHKMLEDKV